MEDSWILVSPGERKKERPQWRRGRYFLPINSIHTATGAASRVNGPHHRPLDNRVDVSQREHCRPPGGQESCIPVKFCQPSLVWLLESSGERGRVDQGKELRGQSLDRHYGDA